MLNQGADRKFIRDVTAPRAKPEKCPKCSSNKVTSCPGGASLKAVPGLWWVCGDCKHQW
jgi:hypothetical protein